MKRKEVWSFRYGRNPAEGVHQYLESKIPNYKRNDVFKYIHGFAEFLGTPDCAETTNLVTKNWSKWLKFLKSKKK